MTTQLSLKDLAKVDSEERMNIFRRYFAASRYNRLLIQQTLIRSANDSSLISKVSDMEKAHNKNFFDTVAIMKKSNYFKEFLAAVSEEDTALSKIIEAYDKRMNRS